MLTEIVLEAVLLLIFLSFPYFYYAQAAAESGCSLLCLQPSTLLSKWSGDSEKALSAAFTAARLLQPCIIFIVSVCFLCKAW